MKQITLVALICLMSITCKAQDCFGEYNSIVSASACINAQGGFPIMEKYASMMNPSQFKFAETNENGVQRTYCLSAYYYDKSGPFSNIYQYIIISKNKTILISYRFIERYKTMEVAILMDNYPSFHKTVNIQTEPTTGLHGFGESLLIGAISHRFVLIFDGGDLESIGWDKNYISIVKQ